MLPIEISRRSHEPLQIQLAAKLRQLIVQGQIRPGCALPGSRELAGSLGVSRNTVVIAYDRLSIEGLLETRRALGTFVSVDASRYCTGAGASSTTAEIAGCNRAPVVFRGRAPRLSARQGSGSAINFAVGRPSQDAFPAQVWRKLTLRHLAGCGARITQYGDPAGLAELRQAIADHLGPARGIATSAAQIIIVSGIQEALNIVSRLLIREATPVAVENPCYQGAAFAFESYGARILPVAVDADGLVTDRLPEHATSLVYVTPSHQFPTGVLLTAQRRAALVAWADRVGAYIVEDDYDSDFRYDGPPLPAVAGIRADRSTIYLGTFSKSIGAGLRIGYMAVPRQLIEPVVTIKALLNNGHNWLDQAVLADFIRSGAYAKHLRRTHRIYRSRLNVLMQSIEEHFPGSRITGSTAGMHVMWHLPGDGPPAREVEKRAGSAGVGIHSLRSGAAIDYGCTPYSLHALVVGYAALTECEIRRGIAKIKHAMGGTS